MTSEAIEWNGPRLAALWRFSLAITVFNLLGHLWLGFEQSFAQPIIAVLTAYIMELVLETVDAAVDRRKARYRGSFSHFVAFLMPAHISGLAISMLLYSSDRLLPMAFAVAVAIGSKYVFRVHVGDRVKHFMNPSNFGITITLVLFHWVGISMPYMFTRQLGPVGDWVLPLALFASGLTLNIKFTNRFPLIATWLVAFFLQAVGKSIVAGTPLSAGLLPFTGVSFLLFTVYMVSDPSTTPSSRRGQIAFGLSLAFVYGVLMVNHVVFTMFFALTIVCIGRGLLLFLAARSLGSAQEHANASGTNPALGVPAPSNMVPGSAMSMTSQLSATGRHVSG